LYRGFSGSDVETKVAYPVLCEICPLILRAKTMVLMKDVRGHMALVNQQGALPLHPTLLVLECGNGDQPLLIAFGAGSWLRQAETLIIHLQQHVVVVLKLADKFTETSEHDSTVSLRSHSVITLTGLSELYRLLVRHPLSTPAMVKEAQKRCADILKMIANITEKMLKEDWRQVASFVRVRISVHPPLFTSVTFRRAGLRIDKRALQDNRGGPMGFAPSESSTKMTLTSAGGFVGAPSPVPSKTFLENLEDLNDQAKRLAEGDEKMVGTSFEVIPKLFRTRVAEGS